MNKVIAFGVLKILHNLSSMQKSLLAKNCWGKQVLNQFFILTSSFSEQKSVVSLHKKWSFPLRISSVNVTKRIWSHLLNKYLMKNVIFCAVYTFQRSSATRPCTLLFFVWKWIASTLSFKYHETNDDVFRPLDLVFRTSRFFLRTRVQVRIRFSDEA